MRWPQGREIQTGSPCGAEPELEAVAVVGGYAGFEPPWRRGAGHRPLIKFNPV